MTCHPSKSAQIIFNRGKISLKNLKKKNVDASGLSFMVSLLVHSVISFACKYTQLLKYSGQIYFATLCKWEGFGKAFDELMGRISLDLRFSCKYQPSVLFKMTISSVDTGVHVCS